MSVVKLDPVAEARYRNELKSFVGKTIEVMLSSKEVTLNVFEKYDIILVCSWEKDYIKGAVYQWSTFNISTGRTISSRNKPLFLSKRYLKVRNKTTFHYDDKRIKDLARQNLEVFYMVCELVKDFKIKVTPKKRLKCFWLDSDN